MSQQNIHAGRTATLFVIILLSVALFVFLAWLYTGDNKHRDAQDPRGQHVVIDDDDHMDDDHRNDDAAMGDGTPVVTHMGSVVRTNGAIVTILPVDETAELGEQSFTVADNVMTKHYSLSAERYVDGDAVSLAQGDLVGFEVREGTVLSKTHFVE